VPRGERTVRRCLRLPVRGVTDSRTVFPRLVSRTQRPRQAANRAHGTPRVERVDQNRQAPTALLRRPASRRLDRPIDRPKSLAHLKKSHKYRELYGHPIGHWSSAKQSAKIGAWAAFRG
jgi:hypothetical protein